MHEYETTFVIDSLLKSDEMDGVVSKYERFISANGGEIKRIERWGKKRLAYEIKKRQYGYYVYIRFSGLPTIVKPLEREFRLNESILRYLTIRLDAKMLKQERHKEGQVGGVSVQRSQHKEFREPTHKFEGTKNKEPLEVEEKTDVV